MSDTQHEIEIVSQRTPLLATRFGLAKWFFLAELGIDTKSSGCREDGSCVMAPCIVGAPGAGATARCGLNNPISELHAGGGPPRGAPSGVASTVRAPSTLARGETVRCAPARAPCVQGPGR